MDLGPSFRKFRATAFTCITVVSLVWTVLTCLVLYMHWGDGDSTQTSLIVVLLSVNVATVILLPALILVEFRAWLDAARMGFLLIAHFSCAIGFTLWATRYQCTEDDDGVCNMVDTYVLLASWVNPALVLTYSLCLGIMAYRHRRSVAEIDAPEKFDIEEATTPRHAELPIMEVPPSHRSSVSTSASKHMSARMSRQPWLSAPPPLPQAAPEASSPIDDGTEQDDASSKRKSTRSSARLSKPLPAKYF